MEGVDSTQIQMEEKRQRDEQQKQLDEIRDRQIEILQALSKKKKYAFTYEEDENKERGNWTGKLDFLLSCLGYAVGLGNVWRFPYLCYKSGGGAFFIPYVIMLFFCGIPIFLLELSIGQFTSQGPLTCWDFAPFFKGIGVGMLIVSSLVGMYYNVIISWALWYLFNSFASVLPWDTCGAWSSQFCADRLHKIGYEACVSNVTMTAHLENGTCMSSNGTLYGIFNKTAASLAGIKAVYPSNDFLNNVGLQIAKANGIEGIGPIRWDLALCLLLAWFIIFVSLSKGIKSSGKVVYFTALFPYLVLVILFFRGITLEGYQEGIRFYITPDTSKLGEAQIWKDAAVQIFFSLSASWGGLIALASYNRFKTDVVRDTLIVSIGNCATSVFAGFVIFSFLGHLAHVSGAPIDEVVDSGVALAFIVYPEAVTFLPISPFWAIIFFIMLITLGLDSEFALIETIVTSVVDQYPKLFRPYKTLVILVICIIFYLCGLCMATPGGAYVLTIMDDYSGGWNIMVIAIMECLGISYVYGVNRFANDIETMVGPIVLGCLPWRFFKFWWFACWCVFTPGLVCFIMIFSWIGYSGSKYGSYVFPVWANAIGWCMTMACIIGIFIPILYQLARVAMGKMSFGDMFKPTREFGPMLVEHRRLVTYVPGFVVDPNGEEENDYVNGAQQYVNPVMQYGEEKTNM